MTINSVSAANERQKRCIESAIDCIDNCILAIDNGEVVDEVFSRFCVGK